MTYTYNPYTFNADDYTKPELHQIVADIINGVCVPENKTIKTITAEDYRWERYEELKGELNERAQDFQAHGYKFEHAVPVKFDN